MMKKRRQLDNHQTRHQSIKRKDTEMNELEVFEGTMEALNKLCTVKRIDPMDAAISTLNRAIREISALIDQYPYSKFASDNDQSISSSIHEAYDMVDGAFTDLVSAKKLINAPYEPHEPHCKCESCVAGRSDEHYDRKRDGEMMNRYP